MEIQGYYKFTPFLGTDFYDSANPIEKDMR